MGRLEGPSDRLVRWVVVSSIAITALHYSDNFVSIHDYPAPGWIQRQTIVLAWSLLTLVGVAGYVLWRDGRRVAGGLYLIVYSFTGLSSLGHYSSGHPGDFTMKMHVFIWMDALVGLAVAVCALWILAARPGRAPAAAAGEAARAA